MCRTVLVCTQEGTSVALPDTLRDSLSRQMIQETTD